MPIAKIPHQLEGKGSLPIVWVGDVTASKLATLQELRDKYLLVANQFMSHVWRANPAVEDARTNRDVDQILQPLQKMVAREQGLNTAYVEKARHAVRIAATNSEDRFWRLVLGRLKNTDSRIVHAEQSKRRGKQEHRASRSYYHIPEYLQDRVASADHAALASVATAAQVRDILADPKDATVTPLQRAILEYCVAQSVLRYRMPVFGQGDEFTCRIDVDYRLVRGVRGSGGYHDELQLLDDQVATLVVDSSNQLYTHFLQLSSPTPRGEPIRVPLHFHSRALRRYKGDIPKVGSLAVEITGTHVVVRAVFQKPKVENTLPIGPVVTVGVDPGYRNTATVSAWHLPALKSDPEIQEILKFDKQAARAYLEEFEVPAGLVERACDPLVFSADGFRKGLKLLCDRIDRLSSRIDVLYDEIITQASTLRSHLSLAEEALVPRDQSYPIQALTKTHRVFFQNLDRVASWKFERRKLYRRIGEKKKHWFGYVGNRIVDLIQNLQAEGHEVVYTPEKYTGSAIPREDPAYRGRTFNRMLSQGALCKGLDRVLAKMVWNGIPHQPVPSYYGSSVCTHCWRVDQSARVGDWFACRSCGVESQADVNAAILYALYFCDTASH